MITSSNVKFIKHLPEASDGVGARVVGNRLFVTTTKDLLVYDVSDPPNPVRLGSINANISFENEEVPTNGKLLGVSGQIGGCNPAGWNPIPPPTRVPTDCLVIYDVSNSAAPKVVNVVPGAGDHLHVLRQPPDVEAAVSNAHHQFVRRDRLVGSNARCRPQDDLVCAHRRTNCDVRRSVSLG